jgi:lipopolysaccharide biosynthesis regulator YciM
MEYLFEVPKRDAEWLSEVISILESCAHEMDAWQNYETKLDEYWHNCASAYLSKARLVASRDSIEAASRYLAEQLKAHPTMKGFDVLLSFYMEQHAGDDVAESLGNLHSLIENQLGQRPKYRCSNCGFSGKKVHWLCPSCKNWGVIKPIVGLDGE